MNIKLVRLVTGEDVLTEYSIAGEFVTFTNPLIVYMKPPTNPGEMASIGLSQWVPYANTKEFTVAADKIVFAVEPAEDLSRQYDSVFGLGLILPSQSLVK